jgi:5-methyltetrahydropteroyltriglutamate--homocysteine methyltransferase
LLQTMTDLMHLRVDQNGSLVAPECLRDAFERHARGEATDTELVAAQDDAIREVIRKQESIGLPVVTDGEFRRRNFQESFGNAVIGYDVPQQVERLTDWREPNKPLHRTEQNFNAPGPAIATRRAVVERLRLKRNVVLEGYRFAAATATRPVKVSLIGPDRIAQRFAWERSQAVYKDIDEFLADVVAIQRRMIAELVAAGCRYVHIDAPGFTAYVDQVSLDRMRARGEDPDKSLQRGIKAENDVIAGFEGVTFGLHICRGNPRGIDPVSGKVMPQWHREGSRQHRRALVLRAQAPPASARIRQRARGRFDAAAFPPERQSRGPRFRHDQECRARAGGYAQAPHRRCSSLFAPRSTCAEPAMRIQQRRRRHPVERG